MLHKEGLCFGCDNGQCLPPLSIVLYARFQVPGNGFAMSCKELAEAWAPLQAETEQEWIACVKHLRGLTEDGIVLQDRGPCSALFSPSLVDNRFDATGRVAYTSSIFATHPKQDLEIYQLSKDFPRGSHQVVAAYDNQYTTFREYYARENIPHDAALVLGSALITTLAMMFHTRSPFLTLIGILQISLSFPLAFTIYRFVGGITWFPFLNLVGLFVGFALGADHVFVAVDKWKNQRHDSSPQATTEDIAGKALPGAGRAMVLTTITTAIAFLGSSICPVLPIKLFAIFVGLLIVVDYILDVLVMFPCLCIYDGYRLKRNCFMSIQCGSGPAGPRNEEGAPEQSPVASFEEEKVEDDDEDCLYCSKQEREVSLSEQEDANTNDDNHNLIRRILSSFYFFLHRFRWLLLALSLAALGVCGYFATTLKVPVTNAEIQFLMEDVQYEQAAKWRTDLLLNALLSSSGGFAVVIWGVTPADTGNHLDPYTWSTLELDESFDPSSQDAQIYMRDFCTEFWAAPGHFADPVTEDSVCSVNRFDEWLQIQSTLPVEDQNRTYVKKCGGATAIPLAEDIFHPCLSGWAQQEDDRSILSRAGVVKVIYVGFKSRVKFFSPHALLSNQWHSISNWMNEKSKNAPPGVAKAYFTSIDWLFWDTSNAVYQTALGSGAIAIVVSAIVILLSSRSLSMTFFSALSVTFVLVSVSALMSAAHWTLGFLESICFTILIGLSADFVLHFSHAYCELPGNTDRHTRTKNALIHLGPSILAAGFTTLMGAFIMLFAYVHFFRLFALVLFFTIVQATIGSFVFFLVLTDCIGPTNPTMCVDCIKSKVAACCKRKRDTKVEEKRDVVVDHDA